MSSPMYPFKYFDRILSKNTYLKTFKKNLKGLNSGLHENVITLTAFVSQ